jgi:xylulokinase
MSLMGIDIGTSGCKAAAFSDKGECYGIVYREYPVIRTGNMTAELDSVFVWNKLKEVIREAAAKAGKDAVTAVCVSSLGEAAIPVSANREILGNSILSSDIRGQKYIDKFPLNSGEFYKINPNIISTSYTLPKLCWLKENAPELFNKTDKFILWDGFLAFMLGCDPFVTHSSANRTLLFDINNEDWSDLLLSLFNIPRKKLGDCVPAGIIAGRVSGKGSDDTGLPVGCYIVSGGHDQCCSALGAGVLEAGRAVDGIGTYECITPIFNKLKDPVQMLKAGLNIEHHVVPGLYVSFLYNQAGSLLRWFKDTFASEISGQNNVYDILGREMPAEPAEIFVLPYFEPTGSPGYIRDASGVITGLHLNTTRGEILKAIMEGVTFYFAETVRYLESTSVNPREYAATGGGARSDAWLQIKADIMGVPYIRPKSIECGIIGAAVLAGKATGVFSSLKEGISLFTGTGKVFYPDTKRHEIYRERLSKYREIYPLLKEFLAG